MNSSSLTGLLSHVTFVLHTHFAIDCIKFLPKYLLTILTVCPVHMTVLYDCASKERNFTDNLQVFWLHQFCQFYSRNCWDKSLEMTDSPHRILILMLRHTSSAYQVVYAHQELPAEFLRLLEISNSCNI